MFFALDLGRGCAGGGGGVCQIGDYPGASWIVIRVQRDKAIPLCLRDSLLLIYGASDGDGKDFRHWVGRMRGEVFRARRRWYLPTGRDPQQMKSW